MTAKTYGLPAGTGTEPLVLFTGTVGTATGDWEPVTLVNSDGSLIETAGLKVQQPTLSYQFDYGSRTDGNPLYVGAGAPGATVLKLQKFTYDVLNRPTSILNANDTWVNRATAVYS